MSRGSRRGEVLGGRLEIGCEWHGGAADPAERATVAVALCAKRLVVTVDAPFHGDPPPDAQPGRLDGLWEHEVVELFLVGDDERYLELELGPHGHWLALLLRPVRRRTRDDLAVGFTRRLAPAADGPSGRWRGRAVLDVADVPSPIVRWNAFAIHGVGEGRRYLAAHPVPGDEPDFHRIGDFPKAPQRAAR